jgi:hypothetical protein
VIAASALAWVVFTNGKTIQENTKAWPELIRGKKPPSPAPPLPPPAQ